MPAIPLLSSYTDQYFQGWAAFQKLLLSLFKFLHPFLKDGDLRQAERDLYRGVLRLLLVILHDFPDFLSENYFALCDAVPSRCVQLRNIILSAFPATIVLPDPHLRGMSLESLPEMGPIPVIAQNFSPAVWGAADMKPSFDLFLLGRGNTNVLPQIKDRIQTASIHENYDLSLLNSIVLFCGASTVAQAPKGRAFSPADPGAVALQYLATNLDAEGTS